MKFSLADIIFWAGLLSFFLWHFNTYKKIRKKSLIFFQKKHIQTSFFCPYKTLFFNVSKKTPPSLWPFIYLSEICEEPHYFFVRLIAFLVGFHFIFSFFFSQISAAFLAIILSLMIIFFFLYKNAEKNKKKFNHSLPIAIKLMRNAIESGQSLKKCFEGVVKEIDGPLKNIFEEIVLKINLGVSLEHILKTVNYKIQIEEFSLLCSALTINFKNGGSLVSVLERLDHIIYERQKTQKKAMISIMSSKSEGGIAIGITLFLLTFMLTTQDKAASYFLNDPDGKFYLKIFFILLTLNIFTVIYAVKWVKAQ